MITLTHTIKFLAWVIVVVTFLYSVRAAAHDFSKETANSRPLNHRQIILLVLMIAFWVAVFTLALI